MKEAKRFIKTPKSGDAIKVYDSGSYFFAICKGIIIGKTNEDSQERELAIVQRTSQQFKIDECDFCLESNKVIEQ